MKRRVAILLVLLPVLVLGTAIAHVLLIPVTAPTSYDDFRTQLDRQMPDLMREQQVPGVAVALVHHGAVAWVQGYGLADTARDVAVGAETMFQAGSISKSVTAWGVMRLAEDGRLDLDSPVSRYLTRWQLPPSAFDPSGVTVRRLLSHTAGLSVHGYLGYDPAAQLPSLATELSVGADAAELDGAVRIAYPPGEEYQYSGGGYTVLQLVVEEVSGESFPTYMQQHVLTPLGMEHSTFDWSPASQATTATPYATDGVALPQYQFTAKAAAGLYTTAADIATFVAQSMQVPAGPARGRAVLAPATVDLMLSSAPHATIFAGPVLASTYGLGYSVDPMLFIRGAAVVGHEGSSRGWKNEFLEVPDHGEGIIVLTNSDRGGALHEQVNCLWVGWATGSTTPKCVDTLMPLDGLIAAAIWSALTFSVVLVPLVVRHHTLMASGSRRSLASPPLSHEGTVL